MRIVLLSDTHLAARAKAFNANLQAALEWVRATRPDLVIHLGDITADGVIDAGELELAAKVFAPIADRVRWLPGNHDIGDNPAAPGLEADPPLDPVRLSEFRNVLGPDWWSLRQGGWQLIGLNALLFAMGSDEEERQFEWLARQVAQSDEPLIVLLHKPLFRDGPEERVAHGRYVPWTARERLLRLLAGRDLRLVISGHVHQARRLCLGPVEHIWVPATSFCIPDPLQEPIGAKVVGVGVLDLTVEEGRARQHFEFASPAGLVRYNLLDHPEVYPAVADLSRNMDPL